MSLSVEDDLLKRSYIPNKVTQSCNNLNISTLFLRTLNEDGNYTSGLSINPKLNTVRITI